MKFPAVTLRQAHERPEGMDEGTFIMTEINSDSIINAVNIVTNQAKEGFELKTVSDYESKNVSQKVLRIIVSYMEYVNGTVWFKHT